MNVFLSYASEDRELAERIQLALVGARLKVFFDAETLPAGGDYHARIHNAVKKSDLFLFLISPHSVEKGSYCLTELGYARDKWPHPKGKVIPVRVSPVNFELIPNYLRAVTIFEPEGNIPAEVLAAVSALKPAALAGHRLKWMTWLVIPLLAGAGWWLTARIQAPPTLGTGTDTQRRTPIAIGMNYAEARRRLVEAGWQPLLPQGLAMQWSTGADSDQQRQLAGAFRKQNWYETLRCAPTGQGRCYHQFFDANGKGLVVVTGSGAYSFIPDVIQFFYQDGTAAPPAP